MELSANAKSRLKLSVGQAASLPPVVILEMGKLAACPTRDQTVAGAAGSLADWPVQPFTAMMFRNGFSR
jgi:hypothetical protein